MLCSVELLKPGMVLEENVYDLERVLLLSASTVLSPESIKIIMRLGYTEINVQGDSSLPDTAGYRLDKAKVEQFQNTYAEMENEVADIIKYISDGNHIDMNQVFDVPSKLMGEIGSNIGDVFAYLNQVSMLDDHTVGHSINVSLISGVICDWIKIKQTLKRDVILAGMLHDIGKSIIPQSILKKPGSLSREEWEQIKQHPVNGYKILKEAKAPDSVLIGALMHHERGDGSGYPLGLKQDKIPLVAKIVAIADIYDAMTSERTYRNKMCPFHVIRQFQFNYFGVLDTRILMTFLTRIAECYIGELVALTDGTAGEIVFIHPGDPAKPLVKTKFGLINLQDQPGLEVDHIII
ncbi:HDIG domain-containing protein [Desulfotomaculum arcticum]|uniref:HDIG domain-containing protein n=1 Tax=Desulfotruncus arcticus DSM 17038 TaxID=1121424 RepID=A0A1I2UEF5_9FIRM|nr:HD-GYP domain-containing protein [Desulfotruncus arcticus]SFG75418.1 HDIG domain-containing protein [Desulfotomaculum arcticum] [Desulfotruncus arcticus DSM 17038]